MLNLTSLDGPLTTLSLDTSEPGLLVVKLNRPAAANAITTRMGHELIAVFGSLEADPQGYRCAVLTAAGDRIFCAGADLKERDGMSNADFDRQHYLFERMVRALHDCPVPLIACVNGAAMAGGLELALACDFIVASDQARFGFLEVKRGIMPGGGGTQQLPRTIGLRRAKELILTADTLDALQALEWGLVNHLFPPEQAFPESLAIARKIISNAPIAVRQAKKAMHLGTQMDVRTALFFEAEVYSRVVGTEDRLEGIRAFVEKRPPNFLGR
jgi:enoyl-CoA hydratase/carnithine racemase